jgi:hypothetical protein
VPTREPERRSPHPAIGNASVTVEGDALIMEITTTRAKLKLEPWDGSSRRD